MALFAHGYERFTSHVDILVTSEALATIHEKLDGPGYLPPLAGSKHLRDIDTKVKIQFLTLGGFPGDGKPQPVIFPNPVGRTTTFDGIRYFNLASLVELKLASGISAPHRQKDLGDVQKLAKAVGLTADYATQFNPYVREKFIQLVDVPADTHGQD